MRRDVPGAHGHHGAAASASLAAGTAFVLAERRAAAPMVPDGLLRVAGPALRPAFASGLHALAWVSVALWLAALALTRVVPAR